MFVPREPCQPRLLYEVQKVLVLALVIAVKAYFVSPEKYKCAVWPKE
jgi:hypothetical protein